MDQDTGHCYDCYTYPEILCLAVHEQSIVPLGSMPLCLKIDCFVLWRQKPSYTVR